MRQEAMVMATVIAHELAQMLEMPANDIYVALANVRCTPVRNTRVYDLDAAIDAVIAFYERRARENENRFSVTHSRLYRQRADLSIARAERIRKIRAEMGGKAT